MRPEIRRLTSEQFLSPLTTAFGVLAIVVIAAGGVWEWRTVRLGRMQTSRSGSAVSTTPVKPPTTRIRPAERNVFEPVCGEEFAPRLAFSNSSTVLPGRRSVRVLPVSRPLAPGVPSLRLQARRTMLPACDSLLGR
jgi:hypothetical protein